MALRQEALGVKGGDERHAVVLDEAQQRIRGSAPGKGQSGHHQRPPAAGQRRCKGRPGLFRYVPQRGPGGGGRRLANGCRHPHVLGQIEMDGARRLSLSQCDGLRHPVRHVVHTQGEGGLGKRPEQRVVVDAHLNPAVEPGAGNVAGDRQHGRAVEPCAAHAGGEVGGSRPQGGGAGPRGAGELAHGGSHEARGGFVGRQHELHRAPAQGLDERQHRTARDTEHPPDSGLLQHADNGLDVGHNIERLGETLIN